MPLLEPEPVTEALCGWLDSSEASIRSVRPGLGADGFCDDYLGVIRSGRRHAEDISQRVVTLVDDAFEQRISLDSFLDNYIDAMSVPYKRQRVFLPSFSDSCLSALHPQSPFRGLHYCWAVGEAYYALRRGHVDEALTVLNALQLKLQHRPRSHGTGISLTDQELNDEIRLIKEMLRDVIMHRKHEWTDPFPYPGRTSTHFYLSGIRFYWSPLVKATWSKRKPRQRSFRDTDRFSVQSTSSGLFSPTERYGYLIPSHVSEARRTAAATQLLQEVPIGKLTLDLMECNPTSNDRKAAVYYSRWSELVAKATLPIVEETIADCVQIAEATNRKERKQLLDHAQQGFEARAGKNPMRTFYFDCGLIAAAKRHRDDPTDTPHVQYVTTQASDPHRDQSGLGVEMFRDVRRLCGDGLRVFAESGEHFTHPNFPAWTLVPVGTGLRDARHLWSNRSKTTAKILHGFEGRASALVRETLHRWGSHLPRDAATSFAAIACANETYARGDMPKEAKTAALTILLVCATETGVDQIGRRPPRIHNALRDIPGSDTYQQILQARDWNRL